MYSNLHTDLWGSSPTRERENEKSLQKTFSFRKWAAVPARAQLLCRRHGCSSNIRSIECKSNCESSNCGMPRHFVYVSTCLNMRRTWRVMRESTVRSTRTCGIGNEHVTAPNARKPNSSVSAAQHIHTQRTCLSLPRPLYA